MLVKKLLKHLFRMHVHKNENSEKNLTRYASYAVLCVDVNKP